MVSAKKIGQRDVEAGENHSMAEIKDEPKFVLSRELLEMDRSSTVQGESQMPVEIQELARSEQPEEDKDVELEKTNVLASVNNSHQVLRTMSEEDLVQKAELDRPAASAVHVTSEDMVSHKFTSTNAAPTAVGGITSRPGSCNSHRIEATYAGPI